MLGDGKMAWAMPCLPGAGPSVGLFMVPPVGAKVWVEFERGDPDYPIWVGGFWDMGGTPAAMGPMQAFTKALVGDNFKIEIVDMPGVGTLTISLTTPAGEAKILADATALQLSWGKQHHQAGGRRRLDQRDQSEGAAMTIPIVTMATKIQCPHAIPGTLITATAKVMIENMPPLVMGDKGTIAGCPFTVPPGKPQPCVTALLDQGRDQGARREQAGAADEPRRHVPVGRSDSQRAGGVDDHPVQSACDVRETMADFSFPYRIGSDGSHRVGRA